MGEQQCQKCRGTHGEGVLGNEVKCLVCGLGPPQAQNFQSPGTSTSWSGAHKIIWVCGSCVAKMEKGSYQHHGAQWVSANFFAVIPASCALHKFELLQREHEHAQKLETLFRDFAEKVKTL